MPVPPARHTDQYRGSTHETNEYPFLISVRGFEVLPLTAVSLDYGASSERLSTGVSRLDRMLSGGLYRGSTVLISGAPGTGKTSLGAHLIDAACARGERALLILFEESPDEVVPQYALDRHGPGTLGGGGLAADVGGPAVGVRAGDAPDDPGAPAG